ncbi:MAG: M56 family metallopeptidase, partial [Planctomycetota bacterium]
MEPFLGGLSVFFWWLVRSTAQVSVLVLLVLVSMAALRGRLPARWQYALWLVVVVRMIMPWAPPSRLSMFNLIPVSYRSRVADFEWAATEAENSSTVVAVPPGPADYTSIKGVITPERTPDMPTGNGTDVSPHKPDVAQREPFFDRLSNWRVVLLTVGRSLPVIWLAGAAVLGCYVCIANVSLWRIVKRERLLTEQKILNLLEDCKEQIGVRTVLGVVVSARVRSPVLFGFLRPRLVLPVGTLEALTVEELRYVFLHELAHVKRNDILLGWVTSVLSVLHWFNPLVWYAFYRMRADREAACDALALSRMNAEEPPAYGRTIVTLLERFSRVQYVPGMVGVLESKVQLERRIVMIAKFKKGSQKLTLPAALAILVVACVSLTDARSAGGGASSTQEPETALWVVSDKPDGGRGTALQFDGASNFVRVPSSESLDIRGSLTLSAWVKNDGDVDGQIIWRGDTRGGHDPYELHITQRK